jgi:hypothetical protein
VLRGRARLAAAGACNVAPPFEFPEHVLHGRSSADRCQLVSRPKASASGREHEQMTATQEINELQAVYQSAL